MRSQGVARFPHLCRNCAGARGIPRIRPENLCLVLLAPFGCCEAQPRSLEFSVLKIQILRTVQHCGISVVRFSKREALVKTKVLVTASSILALIGILTLTSCEKKAPEQGQQTGGTAPAQTEERVEKNPDRNAYFGEEHIHTSWSVDAWLMGNRLTGPDDALKYAQGQTIKHPLGYDIKIDTPMDFMGVTDHSEYVGVTKEANTPGSALSKLPEAQPLILQDPNNQADITKVFNYLVNMLSKPPVKALMSPEVAGSIWKDNIKIADQNNHPGKFTAFCSYEYTSAPDNRNLHRNIFFRDCDKVPVMPYSALDSSHPEDLWKWMDTQRKAGNELLAISHNAN